MIYLDHNATTPILPEVLEEMWPLFTEKWGNASSSYRFGSQLKGVIETARGQVASLLGASPREIIFTSCATESNNTAIHAALNTQPEKRHLITSEVEHSSVLQYMQEMEKVGYRVTYLGVDRDGMLDLAELMEAISDDTALVSLMWANNETGVIFPVQEIAELCSERGVQFHCDAVQAAGKIPIDTNNIPITYLSLAGHKIGAPKGIGALYIRRKTQFSSYIYGGHQEKGRRGGTENVALIAAMGKAAEIALKTCSSFDEKVRPMRDMLEEKVLCTIDGTELNGHKTERLSNTTNILFSGVEAEALLLLLDGDGICASSGSACLADSDGPSHVLTAMKPEIKARQNLRLSLGIENTKNEVLCAIEAIHKATQTLKI